MEIKWFAFFSHETFCRGMFSNFKVHYLEVAYWIRIESKRKRTNEILLLNSQKHSTHYYRIDVNENRNDHIESLHHLFIYYCCCTKRKARMHETTNSNCVTLIAIVSFPSCINMINYHLQIQIRILVEYINMHKVQFNYEINHLTIACLRG